MKIWKRNVVVAAILLFVCAAVYLNWSYNQKVEEGSEAGGKLLGEAALVDGTGEDVLLEDASEESQGSEELTGYFASARLNRQQARDSALSMLRDAAADESANQTMIDEANESIQTMAAAAVSEAQIENLVTAKGYTDCICFIGDTSASVVVATIEGGLTESDIARITEIVKEETGLTASQIKIIEGQP